MSEAADLTSIWKRVRKNIDVDNQSKSTKRPSADRELSRVWSSSDGKGPPESVINDVKFNWLNSSIHKISDEHMLLLQLFGFKVETWVFGDGFCFFRCLANYLGLISVDVWQKVMGSLKTLYLNHHHEKLLDGFIDGQDKFLDKLSYYETRPFFIWYAMMREIVRNEGENDEAFFSRLRIDIALLESGEDGTHRFFYLMEFVTNNIYLESSDVTMLAVRDAYPEIFLSSVSIAFNKLKIVPNGSSSGTKKRLFVLFRDGHCFVLKTTDRLSDFSTKLMHDLSPENLLIWLRSSAGLGNCVSQCLLGDIHFRLGGTALDQESAISLWKQSADSGHLPSILFLSEAYSSREMVLTEMYL